MKQHYIEYDKIYTMFDTEWEKVIKNDKNLMGRMREILGSIFSYTIITPIIAQPGSPLFLKIVNAMAV